MTSASSGGKVTGAMVVVSAPGDTTDDLIDFAHKITEDPDDRELDMLMATGEQQDDACDHRRR